MSVNPRASIFNNTNYTYDNIGRLTQAGSDSFSYDKAGNNQNNNALYNLLNNQLKSSDLYTITYDAMGNIASKYNKLTKTTSNYTFNSRNQLISYRQTDENNQSTKTLSYTYDAFNRRVSKTEDGTEQRYLYDGDDIVAILDNNNAVIATITHDESIDTPLSITNANGTFYYHRDHQGSIVALTDSTGAVVESFTYDNHYGTITNHTVTTVTNNPYAYTGRELDTNELYYYRARYYDPALERFLGEDPIGFSSGDFNFYRYVGNSPINLIDPSGLIECIPSEWIEYKSTKNRYKFLSVATIPITGARIAIWERRATVYEKRAKGGTTNYCDPNECTNAPPIEYEYRTRELWEKKWSGVTAIHTTVNHNKTRYMSHNPWTGETQVL